MVSDEAESVVVVSDTVTGVGTGAAISTSVVQMSSPASLWSMVNQIQLLSLLILLKVYIPDDVKLMLVGVNIVSFDMGFLPISYIEEVKAANEWLDMEQENAELKIIGLKSGS